MASPGSGEDDTEEYIDYLHDRIQFLEEEVRKSHQEILELKEELDNSSHGSNLEGVLGDLDRSLAGFQNQLNDDLDKLRSVSEKLEDYQEPDERTKELLDVTDRLEDKVNDGYWEEKRREREERKKQHESRDVDSSDGSRFSDEEVEELYEEALDRVNELDAVMKAKVKAAESSGTERHVVELLDDEGFFESSGSTSND